MMRRFLPWAMIFALLNVIGLCPALAAGSHEKSSCCQHRQQPQLPCTDGAGNHCPYSLLEKSKSEPGFHGLHLIAVTLPSSAGVHAGIGFLAPSPIARLSDQTATYLLLRVLRL